MDALKLIALLTKLSQLLAGVTPILTELIAAESARTGMTEEQIVAKSLATIDQTDAITREDMQ